ncbi:hypothetical protein RHGRI_031612 [Rhododendron griersonianum]|uniref:Uncharacterized protein n=1 Tax=Rhododendron griersonianum TaxID=479676 RepID=A0AAV6IBY8_9ERIC|nr:hypothetical protein RHGRI_031612 [Rhododendron griersonianum]
MLLYLSFFFFFMNFVYENLFQMLMDLQDWKEALAYCRSTIPVYQSKLSFTLIPQWEIIEELIQGSILCLDCNIILVGNLSGLNSLFLCLFLSSKNGSGPSASSALHTPMLKTQMIASVLLLGDTDNAIKSLSKAMDILRITHGMNTPFMKELSIKLEEAHAEASYKLSSKNNSS